MDYLAKLKDIDEQIKALNTEQTDLRNEYVISASPVQVGDTIQVNGYSHTGKRMIVTKVSFIRGYGGRYRFKADGKVLKKDGNPGLNLGEWYSGDLNED